MFKNAGIFQYNRPFNSFLNPCQKVVSREYFFKHYSYEYYFYFQYISFLEKNLFYFWC